MCLDIRFEPRTDSRYRDDKEGTPSPLLLIELLELETGAWCTPGLPMTSRGDRNLHDDPEGDGGWPTVKVQH